MSLRERIVRHAHRIYCGTDKQPAPDWGCSCGADTADVYLNESCAHCRAPGESLCWACIDEWANDPNPAVPLPPYTVFPGRER